MELSEALRKRFETDSLFRNAGLMLKSRNVNIPSKEDIEADVLKIIAKRANLAQKFFVKEDVLVERYLEFTPTRLHALLISLNRYLEAFNLSALNYSDVSKSGTKVSNIIEKVTNKIYPS